jgi:hypothetical protein
MSFFYEFEDLPLAIVDGVPVALINGKASIDYANRDDWAIDFIYIEGHQPNAQGYDLVTYVPAPGDLVDLIEHRLLDDDWIGKLQNAVDDQIDADLKSVAECP